MLIIQLNEHGKVLRILASLALCWRDEADPAVLVLVVVQASKTPTPISCCIQFPETHGRSRTVFQRSSKVPNTNRHFRNTIAPGCLGCFQNESTTTGESLSILTLGHEL